jgi:hypothetical protein
MDETYKPSISSDVESLTKGTALVAGVAYVCGFIVVSSYLGQFGIYSVSLVRAEYIFAGFLSLIPLGCTCIVGALWYSYIVNSRLELRRLNVSSWREFLEWCVALILIGLLTSVSFGVIVPEGREFARHNWFPIAALATRALLLVTVNGAFLRNFQKEKRPLKPEAVASLAFPVIFTVLVLTSYLTFFAFSIYRDIPFALGGGRPLSVIFLLKPNSTKMPLVSADAGFRSIPYKLVLATNTTYTVLSDNSKEKVIQFNHDAVLGYIVLDQP